MTGNAIITVKRYKERLVARELTKETRDVAEMVSMLVHQCIKKRLVIRSSHSFLTALNRESVFAGRNGRTCSVTSLISTVCLSLLCPGYSQASCTRAIILLRYLDITH
ncbi:hypothetical protein EV1_018286 [Malus domestica]